MQQKSFGKLPSGKLLEKISKSPQYHDGHFQNSVNTPMMAKGVSYFKILVEFFRKGIDREPVTPVPYVKTDLKTLPDGQLVWFGHSSYFVTLEGKKILVDPVFSERPSPVQYAGTKSFPGTMRYSADDFPDIDLVIITHDHYDHLDYNTIVKLKNKAKAFITTLGVSSHLIYWGIEEARIQELDWWESTWPFAGIELIATPARHFSGRGFTRNKTLWASFVLKTQRHRIFIGGDSGYHDDFKKIGEKYGPFDLALLECGQYSNYWPYIHMLPEESVQASKDLQAAIYMPVHWGKFRLSIHPWREPVERALKEAEKLRVKVTTPMIGQSLQLDSIASGSTWWRNVSSYTSAAEQVAVDTFAQQ
ncbi:MBL fold metallo-hydrolase [Ohtaekwangia sp.]|uniref:MBL fold metallo-hydrolase n=1 Tax=Ohtaekwangia sp. TaxID=2066019 RepID=UPI002FDE8B76